MFLILLLVLDDSRIFAAPLWQQDGAEENGGRCGWKAFEVAEKSPPASGATTPRHDATIGSPGDDQRARKRARRSRLAEPLHRRRAFGKPAAAGAKDFRADPRNCLRLQQKRVYPRSDANRTCRRPSWSSNDVTRPFWSSRSAVGRCSKEEVGMVKVRRGATPFLCVSP